MGAYAKSTGAKLYIGASTASSLPAPGSDTFTELSANVNFTPPNNEIATKPYRVLNDTALHSVGGSKADQKVPFTIVLDWANTQHQNLEADINVIGGQKRNYRIVYPDAGTRQYDFVAMLTKFNPDQFDAEAQGEPHKAQCELTVDGNITIAP